MTVQPLYVSVSVASSRGTHDGVSFRADLYERSRSHLLFTTLLWRFPHQCILDGPSIEPGHATMTTSHARHPSELYLPSLLLSNALFNLRVFVME